MVNEHSPTPWVEEGEVTASIFDVNGKMVASYVTLTDKALIVAAVNAYGAHKARIAELEAEVARLRGMPGDAVRVEADWEAIAFNLCSEFGSDFVEDKFEFAKAVVREYLRSLRTRADTGRLSELEAEVARLHIQVASLELLRPLWAQGYSRDSLAAQTLTSALSNLWFLLGAKNQTEAESKLKEILARAKLRGSYA